MYGAKFRSSDIKLDFNDVLIVPQKTRLASRSDALLERKIHFKHSNKIATWTGLPLISANMDTVSGLDSFEVLQKNGCITCFPKHFNREWCEDTPMSALQHIDNYMLSCGVNPADYNELIALIDKLNVEGVSVKFICIDVANGYVPALTAVCQMFRDKYPDMIIAAGNVATPEGAFELLRNGGADIIKVGIGSGAACETRLKAGVGIPQLSAVLECAPTIHNLGGYMISDGGIVFPADVSKALVAGADFVMLGSILAGHTESPGNLLLDPVTNEWYKLFYGMASFEAAEQYAGGMKNYRTSEGKRVKIKHKGSLTATMRDICGSLRSTCTYIDAPTIEDLANKGEFVLVHNTHNTSLRNTQQPQ